MDEASEHLTAARAAHRAGDWPAARTHFLAAQAGHDLHADDLDALSESAWWLGAIDESLDAAERAYHRHLHEDRADSAALTALGMAVSLLLRGDETIGSGWLGRAARLLEDRPECPEHGYVLYVSQVEAGLGGTHLDDVVAAARRVRDIGQRHGDANLVAGGLVGEGRALLKLGDVRTGMPLLDEAMVAVLSDELTPEWAGNVYCHLMAACHELADIGRARAWTQATSEWLAQLPAAVLFTGICRVHRSQVLQVTGAWDEAEREAARVCADLEGISVATTAEAHYQIGEMRRLRGDLDAAVGAYRRARELGRDPQPGQALLHLARGDTDAASTSISAALLASRHDRLARARLCPAQVEIALAADDLPTAARAAAELEATAATYGSSGLEAAALSARGALALTEGRPGEALGALRAACRRWQQLHASYDAARTHTLLARVYTALGDDASVAAELDVAEAVFDRLGASVDARAVAELRRPRILPRGLTEREAEVLALVASGMSNREAAAALVLSEKTIARHLSNIFTKIDVSTRTEAAAFAFAHGLVEPDG